MLNGFEQIWSGGSEVARKMSNPVLLTSPGVFGMAGSPSGLGYDSVAKCKKKVLGGCGGKRYSVGFSAMRHDDVRRNSCACFARTNRCTRMYGAAASRRLCLRLDLGLLLVSLVGRLRDFVALLGDGGSCSACAHGVYSTFAPRAFRVCIDYTLCSGMCLHLTPAPLSGVFLPQS